MHVWCRFVKKQLAVEITSNAFLAHAGGWILKGHTLISFSLYTVGMGRCMQARCAACISLFNVLTKLRSWNKAFCTADTVPVCTAGFVSFVLKLKKRAYLVQFGSYAWTHMILLFVFVPSSFFVSNIFDGIIWFLLPCSLVIINDIGAYLSGVLHILMRAAVNLPMAQSPHRALKMQFRPLLFVRADASFQSLHWGRPSSSSWNRS